MAKGQAKTENIMVLLEPDLRSIVELYTLKADVSKSSYFRKLAIDHLIKEGLLTSDVLLQITEG